MTIQKPTRRAVLLGAATILGTPALLRAQALPQDDAAAEETVRQNISSFAGQDWRDHFSELGQAAILCDMSSRALHFWSGDGTDYRVYPTSVPRTEELTRRGYTKIVRKKVGPSWTPTQSQLERFPDWKPIPPGPENPLGTHAMYLGWPAYIIHGTHDTRKIGRRSSDGCVGLYNDKIAELFEIAPIGTQVRLV